MKKIFRKAISTGLCAAMILTGSVFAFADTDTNAAVYEEPRTEDFVSGVLKDGIYTIGTETDSTGAGRMFNIAQADNNTCKLEVKDGKMTIHITLRSTNIVNLYPGLAEDAQKDGAELLQPVVETVDYNDGEPAEEVNAFDVPVPAIDEEFDLALIGTKGKWYDHKVSVSNPVKAEE